jgi:hypothetical protein
MAESRRESAGGRGKDSEGLGPHLFLDIFQRYDTIHILAGGNLERRYGR